MKIRDILVGAIGGICMVLLILIGLSFGVISIKAGGEQQTTTNQCNACCTACCGATQVIKEVPVEKVVYKDKVVEKPVIVEKVVEKVVEKKVYVEKDKPKVEKHKKDCKGRNKKHNHKD